VLEAFTKRNGAGNEFETCNHQQQMTCCVCFFIIILSISSSGLFVLHTKAGQLCSNNPDQNLFIYLLLNRM